MEMERELGQELLEQVAVLPEAGSGRWFRKRTIPVSISQPVSVSKKVRRRQAWQYLIPVFAGFWLLFAGILIASGFFFLVAALAVIALLSTLVIGLAWAYQNNI